MSTTHKTSYIESFDNTAGLLNNPSMDVRALGLLAQSLATMEAAKQARIANLLTASDMLSSSLSLDPAGFMTGPARDPRAQDVLEEALTLLGHPKESN